MSDISALSHDYEATAQFAERVNTAVLALKKSMRHGHKRAYVGSEEASLVEIVQAVTNQLQADSTPPTPSIPPEVIERLGSQHNAQMGYLLDDLASARDALRGQSPLSNDVLRVLDEICDAADASASAMFRRLRRR
jgi:ABC-type transporter Mla subunit MlaD